MSTLKIAVAFTDKAEAVNIAHESQSLLLEATAETTEHLPFAALALGTSSRLMNLKQRTDLGVYLVDERAVLNQPLSALERDRLPASVGIFPMVANAEIGPEAADKHWREHHAPLALEVHTAMTHYYQLSVMHRFTGEDWNGLALCCFASEDDLRHRFYASKEGKRRVAEDVAKFADTRNSPRRVIARVTGG
jgi:uncharacterized protein (TIGR02118 family)